LIRSDNHSNHIKNAKTKVYNTASEQKAPKHIGQTTYGEEGAYKSDKRTQIDQNPAEVYNAHTWFDKKVSGLTTVHKVDKAYGVLILIVFNIVPLSSYTLRPMLDTFCEVLFRDV
jgi:hypothetical protein